MSSGSSPPTNPLVDGPFDHDVDFILPARDFAEWYRDGLNVFAVVYQSQRGKFGLLLLNRSALVVMMVELCPT